MELELPSQPWYLQKKQRWKGLTKPQISVFSALQLNTAHEYRLGLGNYPFIINKLTAS